MENVKVTLVKSLIACKKAQIATAQSLGLKKPGDSTVRLNSGVTGSLKTERLCSSDLSLLTSDEALNKSNLYVFHYRYPLKPLRLQR